MTKLRLQFSIWLEILSHEILNELEVILNVLELVLNRLEVVLNWRDAWHKIRVLMTYFIGMTLDTKLE